MSLLKIFSKGLNKSRHIAMICNGHIQRSLTIEIEKFKDKETAEEVGC